MDKIKTIPTPITDTDDKLTWNLQLMGNILLKQRPG